MVENAHNHKEALALAGIDVNELGCLMLSVEPLPYELIVSGRKDELYTSTNPDHWWIKGAVGAEKAHATLLYGFDSPAIEYKPSIELLLEDVDLSSVTIRRIGVFHSPFADEPYACIVAHLETGYLEVANQRLRYLPHCDTYPDYQPHVTLAYVKVEVALEWAERLSRVLPGTQLAAIGLDYGGRE